MKNKTINKDNALMNNKRRKGYLVSVMNKRERFISYFRELTSEFAFDETHSSLSGAAREVYPKCVLLSKFFVQE